MLWSRPGLAIRDRSLVTCRAATRPSARPRSSRPTCRGALGREASPRSRRRGAHADGGLRRRACGERGAQGRGGRLRGVLAPVGDRVSPWPSTSPSSAPAAPCRTRTGRAVHARAGRRAHVAVRRRPGRGPAPGGGRHRTPMLDRRGAAHAPPQRPHHRPQRRHHQPLGDEPRADPLPVYGPAGTQPVVDGDPRHARPGHRLPHRPPRGHARGPACGERGRPAAWSSTTAASHPRRRHRPPPGRADGRLPHRARRPSW